MKISEIFNKNSGMLYEMAFSQNKAISIMTSLEGQINEQLVKLACVAPEARNEDHWRHEIVNWLLRIAEIRLKPHNSLPQEDLYYENLFSDHYENDIEDTVKIQIRYIGRDYPLKKSADISMIAYRLRSFHLNFAHKCSKNQFQNEIDIENFVLSFGGL